MSDNASNDKQSLSFDAVHLLRPGSTRPDTAVNRRTKSYEKDDEHRSSIAPLPIVIKIPDMSELVQAAQLSRLQHPRESVNMVELRVRSIATDRCSRSFLGGLSEKYRA